MTKNNLEDHISWLLRTRPFIPPVVLSVGSGPNTGETLDKRIPAGSPKKVESVTIAPAIGTPGRRSAFKGPTPCKRLPVQGHSTGTGTPREPCDSSAMARLQSAPKSASKPQLPAQPSVARDPGELNSNASSSLRDRYSAHCRRVGGSQDTPSTRQTSKAPHFGREQSLRQHPTGAINPTILRAEINPLTVESIDLTGDGRVQTPSSETVEVFGRPRIIWREDSASREKPLPKKGKKRKSDEYDADSIPRTPESGGKRSRVEIESRTYASPRTVSTDTYPDEAPPPYSTIPHVPHGQRSKYFAEDHSQPTLGDDFEEHIVTETRTITEMRRKRKPISRVSSGSEEVPDLQNCEKTAENVEQATAKGTMTARLTASGYPKQPIVTCPQPPTPGGSKSSHRVKPARKQHRSIIPGSDDDDVDGEEEDENYGMRSDFWEDVENYRDDAGSRKNHPSAKPQDSPLRGNQLGSGEDLRDEEIGCSSSKGYESAKRFITSEIANPDHGGKNSQASPFQCDSPTKFAKCPGGETKNVEFQQAVTTVVRQMLAQPLLETKEFQQRLQESLEEKKQQAIGFLRKGDSPPTALTEERRLHKKQFEGVTKATSLKVEYLKLTDLQHELGDKLLEAYDEGYDLSDIQKELNKTGLSLKQKEAEIAAIFQDADLISAFGSFAHPEELSDRVKTQPKVVVQSSQVPVGSNRKFSTVRSSGLSPTQVVKQTQVAQTRKTMPFTPTKTSTAEKSNSWQQMPAPEAIPQSKFSELTSRAFLRASTPPLNPTEIATYFSPKRNSDPKTIERSIGSIQTNSGIDWLKRSSTSSDPPQRVGKQRDMEADVSTYASRNIGDHVDDWNEECSYTKAMAVVDDDDEQYGSQNDEDLLEAEIGLGSDRPGPKNREVFAETSANLASYSHIERVQIPKCGALPLSTAPPSSMQHCWSSDVKAAMKDRFHLRGFRQNQLEAINATLAGKDAFVLMPTGGGKSLCYQLPSIINSGKTRGVTVVISPLLSLMQDQVDHLRELNIQAFLFNGEVTVEHRKLVMQGLRDPNVEQLIQLLYVTPEMITKNKALINAFLTLHDRQKLARLVIDEAHCVSQWGHDFRPDYKAIGEVRQQFRGVPVMALTATATENVKVDVIHNLSIEGCEVFAQSFNRPNLTYEIRAKGKDKEVLDSIANTICGSYMGQSGIIYCLSRQNCERLAEKLRQEYGIKAHHYHAGMEAAQRVFVQKEWQAGRYNVIVATIAFGMGIDKPDVRFVIHHTIPKSLEGYYQETGRAGRDGKRSGCYLYYGYRDTSALKRMIEDGEGSWEQKERQQKMLRNVVHFCENRVDCRRVQVLAYFNEPFLSENCNNSCDNCTSSSVFEDRDLSDYAVHAVNLVKRLQAENVTLLHCVDVFRGSKTKKIVDADHVSLAEYGCGSNLERGDAERLFYRLLSEDALTEHNILNKSGFASQYVRLGRNFREFASGRRKLKIQVRVSPKSKSKTASKQVKGGTGVAGAMRPEFPQSTNVSSPVQQATRRRKGRENHESDLPLHANGYLHDDFVIPDNQYSPATEDSNDSDDSESFEPVRVKGVATKVSKRALSTPITTDREMATLNPIHKDIVESFLVHAKKEAEEIRNAKSLRSQPFSDNILRRMAINFPKDEDEMLQIQGIEPDKVRRYGKKFLKLIRDHHNQYQSIMANNEDMRFDKPVDPSHHDVVVLSSDEGEDMDNSVDGNSAKGRSRFYLGPEVEAFNSQFAQSAHPPAPPPPTNSTSRDGGPRGGARGHSRGYMKKSGRRPSRAGSLAANAKGGIQKKSTSDSGRRISSGNWNNASTSSAYGRNLGGPPKRGEESRHGMFKANSGRGGRGIGMMPV